MKNTTVKLRTSAKQLLRVSRHAAELSTADPYFLRHRMIRIYRTGAVQFGISHMLRQCFLILAFFTFSIMVPGQAKPAAMTSEHAHTVCTYCHLSGESSRGQAKSGEYNIRSCVECHPQVLRPAGGAGSTGEYASSGHTVNTGSGHKTAPLGGKSIDRLDCLSCHVPHFNGQPKLLRLAKKTAETGGSGLIFDPATRLCISCHPLGGEFKAVGRGYLRHPVGISVRRVAGVLDRSQLPPLVDVRGTQNPSDDVIGCTTCHYVHASKNNFLLRWSLAELSSACLKCHPDVAPSSGGLMALR
jgi:predicted CXXCH cytochrome family protein